MGEIAKIGELSEDDYTIELSLNIIHVTFKIDSGAAVPPRVAGNVQKLSKPDRMLCSAGGQQLAVLEMFKAELTHDNGDSTCTNIYLVKNLKTPLLGKPAIRVLNLLKRLNVVTGSEQMKESHERLSSYSPV